MNKYDPAFIEKKWQKYWEDHQTYQTKIDNSRPKFYILDMFPYPSGAGLHVGHLVGYSATDVYARHMRQKGYNVLHPMGWDSFGLPAEQYAVRTGNHPSIATKTNIDTYRRQLKEMGFCYDWNREFATSDPKYYKWTQWIFTKLYEKGLAYEAEAYVNFCPVLGTVLANEEVENGFSVEGGYPVERRPLRQWVLKITAYAERLLQDLDDLDWPDHLKAAQRNWIGRSEGVKIHFKEKNTEEVITCFTTRHDTLFGVTFIVIAPEHPLVSKIIDPEKKQEITDYIKVAINKNDLRRTDLAKDKTGIFTGAYAIHPITGKKIPIWIGDYVLMSYGTGAVMGVPCDDERDAEFAKKYDLEIIELQNLDLPKTKEEIAVILEEKGCGEKCVTYKLRDWLFSRQRYWGEPIPILHFPDGTQRMLELDELPLVPPPLQDYKPSPDGDSPLIKAEDWVHVFDPKTGQKGVRETNIMPQWAGSCWYYLRFCDPHNDKKAWDEEIEKYWMPVDLYVGGVEHAVLHLLYARFWHKVLYDIGLVSTKEPFQKLRNQGLITANSYKKKGGGYVPPQEVEEKEGRWYEKESGEEVTQLLEKMSKSKLNGVSPEDMIEVYGADALRVYELFMSPFDKEKIWNTKAVIGSSRFLNRIYDIVVSDKVCEEESENGLKLGHKLLFGVTEDILAMSFNTAVAKMMEFINHFTELDRYPRSVVKMLIQMIYPFAPHLAEECWELIGEKPSIADAPLPSVDKRYLVEDEVIVVFQVMGKLRGQAQFRKGATKEEVLKYVKNDPKVQKYLTGEIVKEIFVQDKLINLVIK
jgi:leucyl-tRNA synthetase